MKYQKLLQLAFSALAFLTLPLIVLSQEQLKLHTIDSIVYSINHSRFSETTDTANNDIPAYNIFISTIQTTVSDGLNLRKHVHHILNFNNPQKKQERVNTLASITTIKML